ncbi:MAG: YqjK family protein [Oxalobacteraceae bacterium]|nr:YqjK family protein [Oxalobacteraceae bacterium]
MTFSGFALLARRRAELIARSTAQRDALSAQCQSLGHMMSTLDQGFTLLQRIRNNPLMMAGLLVGLAIIKPRRLLPLLRTGLVAWQALRTVTPLLHGWLARKKPGAQ